MPAGVVIPASAYAAWLPPGGRFRGKGGTGGLRVDDHGHFVTSVVFKITNTVEFVQPCRMGVPEPDPEGDPGHVEGPGGGLQGDQHPLRCFPEQWPQLIPAHFFNPRGSGNSSDLPTSIAATRGPASARIRAVAANWRTSGDIAVAFIARGAPPASWTPISGGSRPIPGSA